MLKQFVITAGTAVLVAFSAIAAAEPALLIVSHEVADFDAWKKAFDAGKVNREKAGLTERYVMRDLEKPNFIIVVFESGTADNARQFVADPAFKERIKKASVSGTADIKIGVSGQK